MVEILRISNKIKSRRDFLRHSQLPTSNSKLVDKFQFITCLKGEQQQQFI